MKWVIYFYSGTGNSFRVASLIAKELIASGNAADVIPLEASDPEDELLPFSDDKRGFGLLMPVHGFTLPWFVLKKIVRLPRGKGKKAFVSSTRAGTKWGRVFLPGISGSAMFIAALILRLKGYRVLWIKSFDMPSNWMSLHPGFSEKNARAIITRTEWRVSVFADRIAAGRAYIFSVNTCTEFLWGCLLLPISLPYLFLGRFGLAKLFFANTDCNGCGRCARDCPLQAIEMRGIKNPRPYWKITCESCMRCMAYCPAKAVEASQPLLILYYYASTVPALYIASQIPSSLLTRFPGGAMIVYQILSVLSYFLSLFVIYTALFYLIKLTPLKYLMTYTTLTHFYRRYHEPDTKVNDMK